jgi:spermidine synthase
VDAVGNDCRCPVAADDHSELPQYPAGAYEDSRTTLVYDDCKKYLEDYEGTFDVIILDLADPVEAGPSFPIWTKEYYTTCAAKLSPDGRCEARRAWPVAGGDAVSSIV